MRAATPVDSRRPHPPVPTDPAASQPDWPSRWPLHSYLELGPYPEAVSCARGHATAVLKEWQLGGLADDTAEVVSELVTNAVRHGQTSPPHPMRMWMTGHPAAIMLLIWDASTRIPVMQPAADPLAESGRGLQIVSTLSTRWGHYLPRSGGKVVWSYLQAPQPRKAAPWEHPGGPLSALRPAAG